MRPINLTWVPLVSLVLLLPMTSASKANALDVDYNSGYSRVNIDVHDRDYKYGHDYRHVDYSVFYRRPQSGSWRLAGNYRSRDAAEHTQHELREHGYIARIERH